MRVETSRAKKAKIDAERERVLKGLEGLKDWEDIEDRHIKADALLCDFLRVVDEDGIVEAFQKIDKWYA